jgi:hypothetical protein
VRTPVSLPLSRNPKDLSAETELCLTFAFALPHDGNFVTPTGNAFYEADYKG